ASPPTARWRRRGRDSRWARICNSAAADCRGGTLARVGGVVNAGEEVGVVADCGRKLEAAVLGAVNEARPQRFGFGAVPAVGIENTEEAAAERDARLAAECEQR